jgi:phage gp29-like protein
MEKPPFGVTIPTVTGFQRFLELMPNPDEILREKPEYLFGNTKVVGDGRVQMYDLLLKDPHIDSELGKRKSMVQSQTWTLIPADGSDKGKSISEFVENALKNHVDKLIVGLLQALEYGFSVSEVIWKLEGTNWLPEQFRIPSQNRFAFKPDGTLLLIDDNDKVPLNQPMKFLIHQHNVRHENFYGQSVLSKCFWAWQFKNAGYDFWLTVLQKFGVPSLVALFEYMAEGINANDPNSAATAQAQVTSIANSIAQQLSNIENGSSGAFANVKEVRELSAQGKGDDFKMLIELCELQITKAILGVTLATDTGTGGNYATAKVHQDILYHLIDSDAKNVCEPINTFIKWLVELNFGDAALAPKFELKRIEFATFEQFILAIQNGIPVSKRAAYTQYNLPEPDGEDDVIVLSPTPQGGGNFADPFPLGHCC